MAKGSSAPSIVWDGKNVDEINDFCGHDPLGDPAANWGRSWDDNLSDYALRLSVYNAPGKTMYPVRVGERIVRDADGGLRPDVPAEQIQAYVRSHDGEDR